MGWIWCEQRVSPGERSGYSLQILAERFAVRQGVKVHQKIKGLANNPMKPNVCPTLGGGENTNQTKSFAGACLPAEEETCNKSLVSENITWVTWLQKFRDNFSNMPVSSCLPSITKAKQGMQGALWWIFDLWRRALWNVRLNLSVLGAF